jgi:hypothetical protein
MKSLDRQIQMKTLVMLLVLCASPCFAQWGDHRSPYDITKHIARSKPESRPLADLRANRFDTNSLSNKFGSGSPYKTDGLNNRYSRYGSPYSNDSANNPYATNAPQIYSADGTYHGRLSANRYDPDSTSNKHGRYGSQYSPDSINNQFGAGNPYSTQPLYVSPGRR